MVSRLNNKNCSLIHKVEDVKKIGHFVEKSLNSVRLHFGMKTLFEYTFVVLFY